MKKLLLLFVFGMLSASVSADHCFLAHQIRSGPSNKIIAQEGNVNQAFSPCSTFKIPLALMGFDSGFLIDEMHPVWPFSKKYVNAMGAWRQSQTPTSWIKNSCVWYSQVLTQKMGMPLFQNYVTKFSYGNLDVSGDFGKNNGLTQSWLGSSLKISSAQQVAFLQQMLAGKCPVHPLAIVMAKRILFVQKLHNGWTLYGKTGSGSLINKDGSKNPDLYHGWFVGWIEKGDQCIIFSNHLEDQKKEDIGAGRRARADAINRLSKIIDHMGDESEKE